MAAQTVIYGTLLCLSLFKCKDRVVKPEPAVVEPEEDDFAVTKEVKAEEERVAAIINGELSGD